MGCIGVLATVIIILSFLAKLCKLPAQTEKKPPEPRDEDSALDFIMMDDLTRHLEDQEHNDH